MHAKFKKMAPYFHGGERLQRGRGIGGLLRIASKLFRPLGSLTSKALKSQTGKKIMNAVKDQAIDSSINVARDLVEGKNIKESLKDEFENAKSNVKRKAVNIGSEYLRERNSGYPQKKRIRSNPQKRQNKKSKLRKKRDIFD